MAKKVVSMLGLRQVLQPSMSNFASRKKSASGQVENVKGLMNEITKWTLLIQVAATLFMVGLIWFVQIVHYPLFTRVGEDAFQRYETDHQRLTTWVVGPPMLAEFATAVLLVWCRPTGIGAGPIWFGLALVVSIWLVTFFVQVPQHSALTNAYDADTARNLVLGNWFRTVAWSVRGLLVLWMVGTLISRSLPES